jgi:hypothetical protein
VRFHVLHVRLVDIEPPIWRHVLAPSHLNLEELHHVLQAAMGWLDSHLRGFRIGDRSYSLPDPDGNADHADERERTLDELPGGAVFRYDYDFGDDWEHEILVEEVTEIDADFPLCAAGARACPPEDSGGPGGYDHLLAALRDPTHPEHQEMREWGGSFDPEAFSLQATNAAFVALSCEPPRRGPARPRPRRSRSRSDRRP